MGLDKQAKDGIVFRTTSEKSIREFIEGVDENASTFGFGVREIFRHSNKT